MLAPLALAMLTSGWSQILGHPTRRRANLPSGRISSEDLPVPRVTPKQLLGPHLGGISFVTRAALRRLYVLLLLCPGAAPLNPPPLPSDAVVEGPIQLTLCDPQAKQEYQRVVFLIHLCPGIACRPAASITTIVDVSEYVELVVERYQAFAPRGRMDPG